MRIGLVRFVDRRIGIPACKLLSAFLRRKPDAPSPPRRILFMKWVGFGNLVLASPTVCAVREKYPDADIAFVTLRANKGLLERYPAIDRVYYFDVTGLRSVLRETVRLLRFLRQQRFDLVIDLEQFSRYSALMTGLSGATERVGFQTQGQGRHGVYTRAVPYRDGVHMAEVFGDLGRILGARVDTRSVVAPVFSEEDLRRAENFMREERLEPGEFLIIHPGTGENAAQRRWPPERFSALADRLAYDHGAQVVLSGSPREHALVESIQAGMNTTASSTVGRLNLPAYAALLSQARLLVCSDSGPVHLAAALGVPVVAFYGPNDPCLYGPVGDRHTVLYKGLDCSPCITNFNDKLTRCPHGNCIQSISLEETYLAIQRYPVRCTESVLAEPHTK